MTAIETIMPFAVLALTLGTAVLLFFALRTERRLAARREINLANYRQKSFLFYVTRDYAGLFVGGILAAASLIFGVLAFLFPIIRLYGIALLLLAAVNGGIVYFSLSRQKFARDIRIFDSYYVQVEHLLRNKERTQNDITVCQKRVSELRNKLEHTIAGFNQNLTQRISSEFLPELFAPVDRMLSAYTAEIDRFTDYRYYRESPLPMDLVEDDPCLCAVTYLDGEYREENVKNCYPVKKK